MTTAAADDALTCDAFLGGRLRLWQPRAGYRAATDPVFLAAFVPAGPGMRVLDLGCGVGTAAFCLARRVPGLELHGLELQPDYAALARRNAAANAIALKVHEGDVRQPPPGLRGLVFDQVLANPPFHHPGTAPAADRGRDRANREGEATLADWIAAAAALLAPGGTVTLIHRHDRRREVLKAVPPGLAAVILPLASRAGRAPKRMLMRLSAGEGPPVTLAPFVVHAGERHVADGDDYSPAARVVLREAAALPEAGLVELAAPAAECPPARNR